MLKVYLVTYLPRDCLRPRRIRRRRLIATGAKVQIKDRFLVVDGAQVAESDTDGEHWVLIDKPWWGTHLDIAS